MAISSAPHFIFSESSPIQPSVMSLSQDVLNKVAAYRAVEFVESGMVIGLGTGSTACHAVDRIAELLHQGKLKNIIGIPTSKKTQEQAISLGIPLSDLNKHPTLDLAIDGADEVDEYLNLVKGRGGSLLREKMVESACKKFIVIVDETKMVKHLGGSGGAVPVEVLIFYFNNCDIIFCFNNFILVFYLSKIHFSIIILAFNTFIIRFILKFSISVVIEHIMCFPRAGVFLGFFKI
ncbi:ribose-5-phosphate isomerase [Ranunculus cassubicifolius]